eukprot:Clim_evm110s128 gene=Clim_evmTU110s128
MVETYKVNCNLDGKVAVISGASSGIGKEIASTLVLNGAKVVMGARRTNLLEELKESLVGQEMCHGLGKVPADNVTFMTCDVTVLEDFKKMADAAVTKYGSIDVLINNAGYMPYTFMKSMEVDQWHKTLDINCKGLLNGLGACLPQMMKQNTGHIINMSSDAGRKAFEGLAVYSGTKYFVEAVSRGLRTELAQTEIKVTCIQPGDVATDLAATTTDETAKKAFMEGADPSIVLRTRDIAESVLFALMQPPYAAINEILIEPQKYPI